MSARVKGLSLVAFERALGELQGKAAIERIYPHVPRDVANALGRAEILPMGWYPMEWFASLHAAAQAEFGAEISREIGRAATRHEVTAAYGFIRKFASPEAVIKHYDRVFGLFCESGRVTVEESARGRARMRCSGLEGANRGVWEDVVGSTETLLELCGGYAPSGEILSGGGNTDSMICSFSWQA